MTEKPAPKTTRAKAAVTPFPTEPFAMPTVEVPQAMREFAEKGVAQAKDAYEKMKSAAEEATDVLEDTYETTRKGVLELHMKALDTAKVNTDATFSFVKEILSAKSLAEAIELQTAFARKQFEALSTQAKEFQELATKFATDSGAPMKEAITKAVKDFKTAA